MDEGARKVERQNRQIVAFAVAEAIHSMVASAVNFCYGWAQRELARLSVRVKTDKLSLLVTGIGVLY